MGFKQSTSDPCNYTSTTDGLFILAVYVDNILLAAKSQLKINQVKADIGRQFHVTDMGELHYFLRVNVKQNPETGKIWIGQHAGMHIQKLSSRSLAWSIPNLPVHQLL